MAGGGKGNERPLRHRCVRVCVRRVRARVCKEWRIEAKGEIHRRWIGRGGHESGDEEPPWLVSTGGMRMNAGCKRESIRKGNRWMGLAAYPANAPSDIAVTWT